MAHVASRRRVASAQLSTVIQTPRPADRQYSYMIPHHISCATLHSVFNGQRARSHRSGHWPLLAFFYTGRSRELCRSTSRVAADQIHVKLRIMFRLRGAHVRDVRSLGIVTLVISSSLLLHVAFTSAEGAVHKKITATKPRRKLANTSRARSLSSGKGKGKGGSKGGSFGSDNNNNFAGYGDDTTASPPGIFSDELISTILYPTDPSTTTTAVYPTGPSNSTNEENGFSGSQNGEDVISTDELDQHDDEDQGDGEDEGGQQQGDVAPFEYVGTINAYLPNEDSETEDSKDDQDSVADTTTSAYPPSDSNPQANADDTWAVVINEDHGIDPQEEDATAASSTKNNTNGDGSPQDNNESSPPSDSNPQANADDTWAVIVNGDHGIAPQEEDATAATSTKNNINGDGSPQDNNESSPPSDSNPQANADDTWAVIVNGDHGIAPQEEDATAATSTATTSPDASTITENSEKESEDTANKDNQEDVGVETDSTGGLQIPTDPSTESTTTNDQDSPTDPDSQANQGYNSEAYNDTKGTESDAADNSNGNPTSTAGSIDKDPSNGTTEEGDGNSKEPGPTGSDTTYEDSNEPATMGSLGSNEDGKIRSGLCAFYFVSILSCRFPLILSSPSLLPSVFISSPIIHQLIDIQLLDMPRGLVVSIFLSEADARRLQASPVDMEDEGDFQFVLDGIGETKSTLKDFLARHLNDDLVGTINGLQFISIESISAFLETKSYNGNPTPAVVVSDITGSTYYQGIESPSPRILEANTLGSFNNKDSKDILLAELQASDDNILARTFDIKAEINRGGISPTSDSAVASAKDAEINANSGDAARTSGIAIGGIIIVIALFLLGRRIIRKPTKHNELVSLEEGSDALDEKYDLSSIASETAFESTMITTTVNGSRGERGIVEHNRSIVAYDDSFDNSQKGHGALTPMDEGAKEETQKSCSGFSFSPSSIKKATLDSGLKKEITAASLLGEIAYDMSSIDGNLASAASGSGDDAEKTSSPDHSVHLLEGGLARNHDLDKTSDTNRVTPHSQEQDEDVSIPSTVDLDEVSPSDAAERFGLGIRSFSDVTDQEGNDQLPTIMSSPMPVATPEKRNGPSPNPSPQMVSVRYSYAQSVASVSRVTVPAANLATH